MNKKTQYSLALMAVGLILVFASGLTPLAVTFFGPANSNTALVNTQITFACFANEGSNAGSPFTYTVTWGDGSPAQTVTFANWEYSFTHTYTTVGNYLPFCSVTDSTGSFLGVGSTTMNIVSTSTTTTTISSGTTTISTTTISSSSITLLAPTTTVTVVATTVSCTNVGTNYNSCVSATATSHNPPRTTISALSIFGIVLVLAGAFLYIRKGKV